MIILKRLAGRNHNFGSRGKFVILVKLEGKNCDFKGLIPLGMIGSENTRFWVAIDH